MMQTIVWTVLPRGLLPGGELSLSVLASPRLTGAAPEAPLTAFPAFLAPGQNWASHHFHFGIELGSGPVPVAPVRPGPLHATVEPAPGVLDPALFARLFAAVVVRNHAFKDLRARKIRSFPVARVLDVLRDRYAGTALLSPGQRPLAPTRQDPLAHLDFAHPKVRDGLASRLDKQLAEHGHVPPGEPDLALDFFQAELFHAFKGRTHGAGITPPKVDFHEAVALLADQPALLRRLGFVFDLVVPAPTTPFTRIRVRPQPSPALAPATYTPITPWTAVDHAPGTRFAAAPADPSERRGGFFDLARPELRVTQVDVDGAALKLIRFAESAMRTAERRSLGTPERAGLPALRSAGLSLNLSDRAGRLHRALQRAGALQDAVLAGHGSQQLLHAEDLTRGLRIDVLDRGHWRSLHRRSARLTLQSGAGPVPLDLGAGEEEGTLTTAVTAPSDPAKGDDLFAHEALVHWNGWSLSAPRPGARVDLVGDGVAPSKNPAANALGLAVTHRVVPGSLPRLRFGARYRLRARAVDLAGNSLPHTSEDSAAATPELPYLRFEPVPAPTLSREATPRPGESIDRLVIRSHNATPDLDATPSAETCARGVFPPKAAVLLAEQHGVFDRADGSLASDPATYTSLALRDPIQIPELTPTPTSTVPLPLAEIHYLPDPLARGVRLRGLPGGDSLDIPCAATWPEALPLRLVLRDGDAAPLWDPGTRTLHLSLPKGQVQTIELASLLPGADALDTLGVWHWLAAACPPALLATYRARALAGELWQLTPERNITLVHAVQQPLRRPALAALTAHKAAGNSHANLRGAALLDAASTGELELLARWSDRVDRPGSPTGDAWDAHTGQVGARVVDDPAADRLEFELRHELGDTRHRRVAYDLVATSRFREHFLDAPAPLDLTRRSAASLERDILSSARPAAPEIEYIVPTFAWTREEARDGLASRRRGQSLRVYLRRPWFSSGDGELLGVVLAHGPRVTYADGVSKLEASWLAGQVIPEPPTRLRSLVTRWGSDPTWVSAPAWPGPSLHHFPNKRAQAQDLVLDELGGPAPAPWSLAVAGHEVGFDAERGLWYCDLELDTGAAYFPFVRLALCRFQPRSLAGLEVSRVVLADFVQLTPDRLAWIGSDPEQPHRVRLGVSGEAPRGRADAAIATVVSARVEVLLDPASERWMPAPATPVVLAQTQITATVAVWSGELVLPHPRGEVRQRLVIEEHEILPRDPDRSAATPVLTAAPPVPPGLRCVYADVIEL